MPAARASSPTVSRVVPSSTSGTVGGCRAERSSPPRAQGPAAVASPLPIGREGVLRRLQQVQFSRAPDGFVATGRAELPEDAAYVRAHGVDRDEERGGDLGGGEHRGDEPEHL